MKLQSTARSSTLETLHKARRLVSGETGIIRTLYEAPVSPDAPRIFGCGALCSEPGEDGLAGRARSAVSGSTSRLRDQAIAGAIGEAVERYSAEYVPEEKLIFGSYVAMCGRAIAPWSLTLYSESQYAEPDFPFDRLEAEAEIAWVEAHSLTRDRAVLVPAFAVYQPYRPSAAEKPVIQQVTTGLACGNTLEEAILSGICEVVERDAAMLMWLQSRRPPRVDGRLVNNAAFHQTLDRFGVLAKYVTLLDVTTDTGIPAYVAVWDGPIYGRCGAVFASCAKLDAWRAAVGALNELSQCLMWSASLIDEGRKIPDPAATPISEIVEHVLWPMGADARPAFSFVFSSAQSLGLRADTDDVAGLDVLGSIRRCVARLAACGMEVLVVDVTAPDVVEVGLHVVRIIVPQAQPLFFGSGLQRVSCRARAPTDAQRASNSLNLHPHPFP